MVAESGTKLVIVESPAKAKTIAGYLGAGFEVEASVGHIRDLPTPSQLPPAEKKGPFGKFAVDVENGFAPYYVVSSEKKTKVAELKRLLRSADELYLATDEDREGEAIAWHLLEVLKPKVPVKRMVFHEITKDAITKAVQNTRDLDHDLVDAQESRRILDRLYGYEVSPVLWRKVRPGLSAGRVQSVSTRLVVERERERMAFVVANYWDASARFVTRSGGGEDFTAKLTGVGGVRVASGRDFSDAGELTGKGVRHLGEVEAQAIASAVSGGVGTVTSVQEKPYTRRPAAPFTTSTLQQEAGRKLRLSSRNAMRVAQRLYENGYITYMRTDSTTLSESALSAARGQARDMYGAEFVPDKPRRYEKKVKNAQEAHEAIRPAGDVFRTPAQVAGQLTGEDFALYELIWKRTVASQMADARGSTASLRVSVPVAGVEVAGESVESAEFSASGTVITFRGFLAAYEEGRDEDRRGAVEHSAERRLPKLGEGVELDCADAQAEGHQTNPPARYTEATLVKAMEELGIGRPSTYAATVATIQDRGYVNSRGQALVPTWLAFAVTRLLEEHFPTLVDYQFTARMEEDLDAIASGDEGRVEWLTQFYFGNDGAVSDDREPHEGLAELVANLGEIDAKGISTIDLGEGMVVRVGRYGPYVEEVASADGEPVDGAAGEGDSSKRGRRATVNDDIAPDEMTPQKARELLELAADDGRELGKDPQTGHMIVAKSGRFGPYVSEILPEPEEGTPKSKQPKPRTASLFRSMNLATVSLDEALKLLSLPRVVGVDPDSGEEITAQNGRYGPYLKKEKDSRSLDSEDQIFTVTLEEALALYAQPKRRGRAAARPPIADLGPDPVTGKNVVVKEGRFGPYVTDGETNATLRSGDDPETITAERGFELLAEKRAKGPVTRKRATAKKTPAKKSTAKKATTKKAAPKKA
ncbi:type I DNA topoisomerase [Dermatophilus congolensis]|uniref:type I DNA topoisomerase n=1 Tax=Dermatophilus congolensis TaxID=1863 RepID=UPI001AAFF592|nr:type I DNA topoisomerase [Dermatophilus congolensis]MBO3153049.1 type I DNA topoisomerase [Dermatophilus congolensis]MBO3159931.1 type I DNA topoisomerase [Dermatophilus congolensis]MBO3164341.1 type I DNA topoisomerase [Dermatophilus congolensis]MBO3177890.1 type I DNA topoisomerase [Dermatophilus congolensis]